MNRLNKADVGWFTHSGRDKELVGGVIPERIAQLDDTLATLTSLREAAIRSPRQYGMGFDANGRWISTVPRPAGSAPTAAPEQQFRVGNRYLNKRTGKITTWDGSTMIPSR